VYRGENKLTEINNFMRFNKLHFTRIGLANLHSLSSLTTQELEEKNINIECWLKNSYLEFYENFEDLLLPTYLAFFLIKDYVNYLLLSQK